MGKYYWNTCFAPLTTKRIILEKICIKCYTKPEIYWCSKNKNKNKKVKKRMILKMIKRWSDYKKKAILRFKLYCFKSGENVVILSDFFYI